MSASMAGENGAAELGSGNVKTGEKMEASVLF